MHDPDESERSGALVERFQRARHDPELTVLEGFHAVKHALRFGAEVVDAVTADPEALADLVTALAPDLSAGFDLVRPVSPQLSARLGPRAERAGVIAIARRPLSDLGAVLGEARPAPVILLENPSAMGNLGACVRVAAGADAAAVLSTGRNDPWHPDAVRGAAGLHYALPVIRIGALPASDRPLIAVDPGGAPLDPRALPPRAVLAFGTERHGLSRELLGRADATVGIPMRAGVSSLNLATAVSAVLFARRLGAP